MLSVILTWVGAVLGIGILLTMAIGALVLDMDETHRGRRQKHEKTVTSELTESPQRCC